MKTIANKISLAITLSTVLVGLVLGALIYFQSEALLRIEAERNLTSILDREAEALNNEFTRVKRLSHVLRSMVENTVDLSLAQNDPTYMDTYEVYLSSFFKSAITDFDNVSAWVLFNSEIIPGANTVSYTFEEGAFVREPEYDAVQDGYANEAWWKNAVTTGENWTAPYFWEPWSADIITYSIPITLDNQLIAVTGAELFLKPFQERLMNIRVYDSGFVMLFTNAGDPVYLPDELDPVYYEQWYRDNQNTISKKQKGVQYLEELGHQEVLAWRTLDNGWVLIAKPKVSEMFGGLASLNYITLATMASSIPLAILIGFLISRTLTRRLEALTLAAHQVLDHGSQIQLEDHQNDEIGTLTQAFVQMQRQVRTTLSQLTVNEAKYRSLVENAETMIFTIDTQGRFLTTNRRLEEMAGIPKESLIGQSFTKLFRYDDSRTYWAQAFQTVLESHEKSVHEKNLENPQGELRTITTSLIPVFDENGDLAMVMGTSSDITERLNAEKRIVQLLSQENETLENRVAEKAKDLENALKELMEADKLAALGRLVAGVSHEMNTPLGNAITLSSFLEYTNRQAIEKLRANQFTRQEFSTFLVQLVETVDSINRNLARTANLVNNFKSMSVTQSAEAPAPINLNDLLSTTLSGLYHECHPLQIQMSLDCNPNLMVRVYPAVIMQIITNLVMNAVKHAFEGINHPQLNLSVTEGTDSVTIIFKDNGVGMSPEVLTHIFEPFFTTKRGKGNSGLGLSIVYNTVITTLKGTILCESTPQCGTAFFLTIPK